MPCETEASRAKEEMLADNGQSHCHMMDTCFRTSQGCIVAASKLVVDDELLDHYNKITCVKWCRVYGKEKHLLVDLHTKGSKLTVTGSHRVVVPGGECTLAKDLSKGDEVMVANSSGCEPLLKVTKRTAYTQVVELEFDGDASMPVWVPAIITKGSIAPSFHEYTRSAQCKEEKVDMDMDGMAVGEGNDDHEVHSADSTVYAGTWPDTDDGF